MYRRQLHPVRGEGEPAHLGGQARAVQRRRDPLATGRFQHGDFQLVSGGRGRGGQQAWPEHSLANFVTAGIDSLLQCITPGCPVGAHAQDELGAVRAARVP